MTRMELGYGIGRVLTLCLVLGASSFIVGILPLTFTFSAKHRLRLSTFGNGLLLGAALGVIIPEGTEALMELRRGTGTSFSAQIALSLLTGFTFMLVVEQILATNASGNSSSLPTRKADTEEYDLETLYPDGQPRKSMRNSKDNSNKNFTAYTLTLGLVVHSLADGLALGASAVGEDEESTLSIVVFIALFVHKAPTALALTSSLISTSLSRAKVQKHIALFSAATPLGALASFFILNIAGTQAGSWTGIALLISGGSFLYVATVIQPTVIHSYEEGNSPIAEELSKVQRLLCLIGGIFLPVAIGTIVEHKHGENNLNHYQN